MKLEQELEEIKDEVVHLLFNEYLLDLEEAKDVLAEILGEIIKPVKIPPWEDR